MTLDPFLAGWLLGALAGGAAGVMLTYTIASWKARQPRRLDYDDRLERIRRSL